MKSIKLSFQNNLLMRVAVRVPALEEQPCKSAGGEPWPVTSAGDDGACSRALLVGDLGESLLHKCIPSQLS